MDVWLSPTFGGHTAEFTQSDNMTMDNIVLGTSNLLKGEQKKNQSLFEGLGEYYCLCEKHLYKACIKEKKGFTHKLTQEMSAWVWSEDHKFGNGKKKLLNY